MQTKKFNCPACGKEIKLKKVKNKEWEHLYKAVCDKCKIEWEVRGYFVYKLPPKAIKNLFGD